MKVVELLFYSAGFAVPQRANTACVIVEYYVTEGKLAFIRFNGAPENIVVLVT